MNIMCFSSSGVRDAGVPLPQNFSVKEGGINWISFDCPLGVLTSLVNANIVRQPLHLLQLALTAPKNLASSIFTWRSRLWPLTLI